MFSPTYTFFQVGRYDLRLISPDRKQVLLHKQLKDIASCVQGIKNPEHFGFICREATMECFIGYVFKCQSESVADDLVGGNHNSEAQPLFDLWTFRWQCIFFYNYSYNTGVHSNMQRHEKGKASSSISLRALSDGLVQQIVPGDRR